MSLVTARCRSPPSDRDPYSGAKLCFVPNNPVLHRDPQRLAGLVIHVDLADLAELRAVHVDGGLAFHVLQVFGGRHACSFSSVVRVDSGRVVPGGAR